MHYNSGSLPGLPQGQTMIRTENLTKVFSIQKNKSQVTAENHHTRIGYSY